MKHPNLATRRPPVLDITLKLEGYFTVELIDAKTQRVKRKLRFKNVITNAGLDFPTNGPPTSQMGYLAVGTGSTTPAVTDTALVAEIRRTASTGGIADQSGYVVGSPDYAWFRTTRTFIETEANGNLTELGFYKVATGGVLFNRQLFKDAGGVPTTITKTSAEQLRVSYEIRMIAPTAPSTGTFLVNGVTYNYSLAYSTGVGGQWLNLLLTFALFVGPEITNDFGGALVFGNTVVLGSYVAGQYYRDITATWEPSNTVPASQVGLILFAQASTNGGSGRAIFAFTANVTPKIPKSSLQRLTLTVRVAWARA